MSNAVIPAKAGIQCMLVYQGTKAVWIPAFAGMTMVGSKRYMTTMPQRLIYQRLNTIFGISANTALNVDQPMEENKTPNGTDFSL
jgi:hypothetical protein